MLEIVNTRSDQEILYDNLEFVENILGGDIKNLHISPEISKKLMNIATEVKNLKEEIKEEKK